MHAARATCGRAGALAAAALGVFLVAACADLTIEVTVHVDGSATLLTEAAFDRATVEQLTGGTTSPDALLALAGIDAAELPPGVTVTSIADAERVGAALTVAVPTSDDPAAALDDALRRAGGGVNSVTAPGGPFDSFAVHRTEAAEDGGDGWRFAATTAGSDAPDGLSAFLLSDGTFTFRLALPGALADHNADRIEESVLIWDLALGGPSRDLHAASQPSEATEPAEAAATGDRRGPPVALVALATFVIALLGGLAGVRRARRR